MTKRKTRSKLTKARMHGAYSAERKVKEQGDSAITADNPIGAMVLQDEADVISDLGGDDALTGAHRKMLRLLRGDAFVAAVLDEYIAELGPGIVNRRHRKPYPILEARGKYADRVQYRLKALYSVDFKRKRNPVSTIEQYKASEGDD